MILLFYVPFGLCDLPLNLLTKKFSGKVILPILMIFWGSLALIQCAAKNFAGLLVIRLLLGACEAGFFAGVVFYLTLFYKRNELGFRIAIFFGSALLAAAFSGLIAFGVFQIRSSIEGWKWLFLIEGGMTVVVGVVALFWLPGSPETAWFLNNDERAAARARSLRDSSKKVNVEFNMKAAFQTWKDWKFPIWVVICFTYPVAFSTTSNFLPQVRLPRSISDGADPPDRPKTWIQRCQNEPVDCSTQLCWIFSPALHCKVLRLLQREDLPHRALLVDILDWNDHPCYH